jgi:hypothetical protein
MPTYTYRCPKCSKTRDILKRVVDIDRVEHCVLDDEVMIRQLSAPAVRGDYEPYTCPISGTVISGRRAHEENLARHGCRVLEPGETSSVVSSRKAAEARLDSEIEATAEQFVHALPVEKRDRLCAELEAGVSAEILRN